jgi:hypothetical protein
MMLVQRLSGDTFPTCAICLSDKADHKTGPMVDLKFGEAGDCASIQVTVAVHARCLREKLP